MAEENEVGSSYISITPSAKGFSQKLQKEMGKHSKVFDKLGIDLGEAFSESFTRQTTKAKPKIKPELDEEDVRKKYEKLKEDIEKKKPTIEPEADTATAEAQMKLATRDRLVKIHAQIEKKSLAGVTAALAGLTGGRAVKGIFEPIGRSLMNLDKSVPNIAATTLAIGALSSAALAASGGLIAIGGGMASIAGAGLLLPGILGGAAIGATVFGLALSDTAKVLGDLGPQFKALKTQVSGNFWAEAEKPIRNMVSTLLPQMRSQMAVTATAIGAFAGKFTSSLTGALTGLPLATMFDGLNKGIKNAEAGIPGVTTAISILGVTGASYLPRFGTWLSNISNQFGNWLAQAQQSGQLTEWIETALINLRALGSVIGSTGSILKGFFDATQAAGFGGLVGLADSLERVATVVNGPAFQGALIQVLMGAKAAMDGLSPAVGALGDMFVSLAPTISHGLASLGGSLGAVLKSVFDMLGSPEVASGLNTMIQGISSGFRSLAPAITAIGPVVGAVFGAIGTFAKAIFPIIGSIATQLAPVISGILAFVTPLVSAIGSFLLPIITAIVAKFADWAPMIAVVGGAVLAAVLAFKAMMFVKGLITGIRTAMLLLNAAMLANPVVLIVAGIIAAIALLVGAFILMYNKVDWFRNMVNAAWANIKIAINAVVLWFQTVLVPIFKTVFAAIGQVFTWLYNNIVKPVFNGIKTVISFVVLAIRTYINIWVSIFRNILAPAIRWIYDSVVKPVFTWVKNFIGRVLNGLKVAFNVFKTAIQLVWNAIKKAINVVWNWIRVNIFRRIELALIVLKIAFQLFRKKVAEVFNAVRSKMSTVWNWIKTYVFNPIKDFLVRTLKTAFNNFKNNVSFVFGKVKSFAELLWSGMKVIFNKIKDGAAKVGDAFNKMKDTVKAAFEKAKDVAKKPIKLMVGFVNDPLIKGINAVGNIFDLKDIPKIKLPKGFAKGGSVGYGSQGSIGGYTGNGRKFEPAGVVHRGEYVVKKSATSKIQKKAPGLLGSLNSGHVPGFASGGAVDRLKGFAKGGSVGTLSDSARWWQDRGGKITEFGAWGQRVGSHSPGSYHYSGKAYDLNFFAGTSTREQNAIDKHMGAFRNAFPNVGVIWKQPNHWNHAHFDTSGGAKVGKGGSGGGFDLTSLIPGLGGFADKIKEKIGGDSPFGKMIMGAGTWMLGGIKDWLTAMNPFAGEGSGEGNVTSSATAKEAQAQAKNVAESFGWGSGAQWRAILELVSQESSWDPHAANPTTSARGLFQKMTSIHGAVEPDVAGQTRWGLNYIKGRYGNPVDAWNFHKRNNWYANGGLVDSVTRMDNGGYLPKGNTLVQNATSSPERIRTADEEMAIQRVMAQSNSDYAEQKGNPVKIDIHVNGASNPLETANAVSNQLTFAMRKHSIGGF